MEYGSHDYNSSSVGGNGGRRASLTDSPIYPQTSSPPHTTSDFCTIRRGTRTQDHQRTPLSTSYHNGSVGMNPNARPMNGNTHTLTRHSTYTPHGSYSPPPPPPYPRGTSKRNSPPGAPVSPSNLTRSPSRMRQVDDLGKTETKYIFSSEAMLKPGTLV